MLAVLGACRPLLQGIGCHISRPEYLPISSSGVFKVSDTIGFLGTWGNKCWHHQVEVHLRSLISDVGVVFGIWDLDYFGYI